MQPLHFFPGEKQEGGRGGRRRSRSKQGRRGDGLATNCTITTFRKKEKPLRFVSLHNMLPASAANVAIQRQGREARALVSQPVGSRQGSEHPPEARYVNGGMGAGPHHLSLPDLGGIASTHENAATALSDHGGHPSYCAGEESVQWLEHLHDLQAVSLWIGILTPLCLSFFVCLQGYSVAEMRSARWPTP